MKQPTLYDFMRNHEKFSVVEPVFAYSDFPFDEDDFEKIKYMRQLCMDDYEGLRKVYELYNEDSILKPEGTSLWEQWGSVIEEFEFMVNLWVKSRLLMFIGTDGKDKIRGSISDVDCVDMNEVNVWIQRSGDKEFLSLFPYDRFFRFCNVDWATESLWVLTRLDLIKELESADVMKLIADPWGTG